MNQKEFEELEKEIHRFIEQLGDKYIDGYDLIKHLKENLVKE